MLCNEIFKIFSVEIKYKKLKVTDLFIYLVLMLEEKNLILHNNKSILLSENMDALQMILSTNHFFN